MPKYLIVFLASLFLSSCQSHFFSSKPKDFHGTNELYPVPKEAKVGETLIQLSERPIILIGQEAELTEKFAAQRLQKLIKRKSNITLPIFNESEDYPQDQAIFLLGQRSNNALLNKICEQEKIKLTSTMPNGFGQEMSDGFIIQTLKGENKKVVIVGGSNSRGVSLRARGPFRTSLIL